MKCGSDRAEGEGKDGVSGEREHTAKVDRVGNGHGLDGEVLRGGEEIAGQRDAQANDRSSVRVREELEGEGGLFLYTRAVQSTPVPRDKGGCRVPATRSWSAQLPRTFRADRKSVV